MINRLPRLLNDAKLANITLVNITIMYKSHSIYCLVNKTVVKHCFMELYLVMLWTCANNFYYTCREITFASQKKKKESQL